MITIKQLLESVDLDFEPRWVTKDESGIITIWADKPSIDLASNTWIEQTEFVVMHLLKLANFENKDWTECIYKVPRKITGKIEKLERHIEMDNDSAKSCPPSGEEFMYKINQIVDYVNALIESNNIHEKQIDKLQMKLEPEKCAVNELKGVKNE